MDRKSIIFLILFSAANSGYADPDISFRMIGGKAAKKTQFPFLVSIQTNNAHICGGSLIAKDWVLSAAKCFDGNNGPYDIVVGTNKLGDKKSTNISVLNIIVHEGYKPDGTSDNIALLKLSEPIKKSKHVRIIDMYKKKIKSSKACVAVGWGFTKNTTSSKSSGVRYLKAKTMATSKCQKQLRKFGTLHNSDMCTFTKADRGVCEGDLGNPIVLKTGGRYQLIAILNWGVACAKGFPDVSSRISFYYKWIKKAMKKKLV